VQNGWNFAVFVPDMDYRYLRPRELNSFNFKTHLETDSTGQAKMKKCNDFDVNCRFLQQTIFIQASQAVQYRVNETPSMYPIFRHKNPLRKDAQYACKMM